MDLVKEYAVELPQTGPAGRPQVSVVLPIFNEVKNILPLLNELVPVLASSGRTFEIICVDDGSIDGSYAELVKLHERDGRVRVRRFRRNFGQTAAFAAGFDWARGHVVITMDADLQNDPADIPKLLAKIEEGNDVVSGWRRDRWNEGLATLLTRRFPSAVASWLISAITGVKLHDYGCALKAYRSEVVKGIKLYGDLHRFIPAISAWMGVQVAEVPVQYRSRRFGQSKYGMGRILRVVLDLLTVRFLLSYSTRPIHIFGSLGLLAFALGCGIGLYLTVMKYVQQIDLTDRPALLLALLLVMVGVQLVTMGLLGELVVRTYHESQDKPIYVIRSELGRIEEDD